MNLLPELLPVQHNVIQMNEMRRNDDATRTNAGTKKLSPVVTFIPGYGIHYPGNRSIKVQVWLSAGSNDEEKDLYNSLLNKQPLITTGLHQHYVCTRNCNLPLNVGTTTKTYENENNHRSANINIAVCVSCGLYGKLICPGTNQEEKPRPSHG